MPYNIVVPKVGSENLSTKDMAISLLCKDWPMSIKQIYNQTKKAYPNNVTYQAVFKSVKSLFNDGILVKNGVSYSISKQWLDKTSRFIKQISDRISNNQINLDKFKDYSFMNRTLELFEFNSFNELFKFLRRFEFDYVLNNKMLLHSIGW